MTASLFSGGDHEGRVYLTCDGCHTQHTIHAYAITKTRTHAGNRGWQRTGEPGHRRDWCPDCHPAVAEPVEAVPSLFDLHETEEVS